MKRVLPFMLVLLGAAAAAQEAPKTVDYVVGAQDVLTITVFDEPQLSGRFRVDADGSFAFPFLGRVKAVGLTLRAIEADLRQRLREGYLRNPQVTVEVDQFRSQSVFVMGEVRSPGKYALSGTVTLIEALAQAGSVTSAAGNEILIIRAKEGKPVSASPGQDPGTDPDTIRVNLRELEGGKLAENLTLRDGDTIFVPKADRFFVIGQVRNPGSYVLDHGMTVMQAISLAGGTTDRGSNRRVRIVRMQDGKKREFDAQPTDLVQPGDTVVVRQRLL
jgi:polysaccharide biosynthesis/export protein